MREWQERCPTCATMIRDIWGNAKGPAKRDVFCPNPECAQALRIVSIGNSLYGLAYPSETITRAIRRIRQNNPYKPTRRHGGSRPGAGRKPRQDGRKSRHIRVMLTENEYRMILDLTNPDERRRILMAHIDAADMAAQLEETAKR